MTDTTQTLFVAAAKVINVLVNHGFEAYAVGGFVRDHILGREAKDVDIATDARPDDIVEAVRAEGLRFFACENAIEHGTITVMVDGVPVEVTTFRLDVATDGRNATVEFANRLSDDLARRDFTFNAMALELNGTVTDLFEGQADLKKQRVRFVGNPDTRVREDALRMLRAVRFATVLNFNIEKDSRKAIMRNLSLVHRLSPERIASELLKILASDKPSVGLQLLHDLGLMGEILPEIEVMTGMEQRSDYHHKDVFDHTLLVVDNVAAATEDVELRLAALLHDVGKPITRTFTRGVGYQFIGHDLEGSFIAEAICQRFRLSNTTTKFVKRMVREHLRLNDLTQNKVTDTAIRRVLRKFADKYTEPRFENFFDELVILTRADITSHNPSRVELGQKKLDLFIERVEEVKNASPVQALQSPLDGFEIQELGVKPGPELGRLKKLLTDAVVDGVMTVDDKEAAKQMVLDNMNN